MTMARRGEVSDVVDGVLKLAVFGGVIFVGLAAPNAIQALDKPLKFYFKKMDARDREREIRKTLNYMRKNGLINKDYQHGLQITKKGQARAKKASLDDLKIPVPHKWDKKWRLVIFDIPEKSKSGRDALTRKIKQLGFRQLQKSVWIFPHPCRQEIEIVCSQYFVERYVTYIETSFIDKQEKLQKLFNI